MDSTELEEFAKLLVKEVRDKAIQSCDRNLLPNSKNAISKRWREAAGNGVEAVVRVVIADVVDSTIAHLLAAIDQEMLPLSFARSNGASINLVAVATESGELSGWYMGEWREKYSKERFPDDFSHLKHFFDKPSNDRENK